MTPSPRHQERLRQLPAVADLLQSDTVVAWLKNQPRELVTNTLRAALAALRKQILSDQAGRCGSGHVSPEYVLREAEKLLKERTAPHLRGAINATGIILHTGLGRAVLPESVVDSMVEELKGYLTLAIDLPTGERIERDPHVEYLLCELTGAEAATVVNNNAAATLLVLAALTGGKEVIVSRGQLIEIGGSFRLPEVMSQSGTRLVEVGTTNRTHRKDYEQAVTEQTAGLLRVHPSNFRVVGFTAEVELRELVEIAHARNLLMLDDLGAGALVDLAPFGLPHEPTVAESVAAGADVVLFSGDKLIGAGQCGIIVGKKPFIERIRKHPLYRALRVDKTCLMTLERTLFLFRDPARLAEKHPTYRMLATPAAMLRKRAEKLKKATLALQAGLEVRVAEGVGFLGSGALPMEKLPGWVVCVTHPEIKPSELARRLRMDAHCVIARVENEQVLLDVRTIKDEEGSKVVEALHRATALHG